jgi:DNA polymerase III epsilon subunit family exonuclease
MKIIKMVFGVIFGLFALLTTILSLALLNIIVFIFVACPFILFTYLIFKKKPKKFTGNSYTPASTNKSKYDTQWTFERTYNKPPEQMKLRYEVINICTKKARKQYSEFVVFDLETTGLSPYNDKIIEIGAIKISNGIMTDSYTTLVNPLCHIPSAATNVNGITDNMVSNAPTIDTVLPLFINFIGNSILVAHNATFDMGFLRHNMCQMGCTTINPVICTLLLSRKLFPEFQNHKLETVASSLGISLNNAHRSLSDVTATGNVFLYIVDMLNRQDAEKDIQRKLDKKVKSI